MRHAALRFLEQAGAGTAGTKTMRSRICCCKAWCCCNAIILCKGGELDLIMRDGACLV